MDTELSELLNMPELLQLDIQEEQIFEEGISDREKFSTFTEKYCTPIINKYLLNSLNNIEQNNSAISFIAGSRAWHNFFTNTDNPKTKELYDKLPRLEKTAIIPGNFDVFCICTNRSQIDRIIHEICLCFDKIEHDILEIEEISNCYTIKFESNAERPAPNIPPEYSKTLSKSGFYNTNLEASCPIETPFSSTDCVFPKCKALQLELLFEPIIETKGKGKKKKEISLCTISKKDIVNNKVLFYFEIIYINNDVIPLVKDNLLSPRNDNSFYYLNLEGLYLFLELIVRRDKEYNIDMHRQNILQKTLQNFKSDKKDIFKNIIIKYMNIFKNVNNTTEDDSYRTEYDLKLEILLKKYINMNDIDVLDDFSAYITEKSRPYINSFIYNIHVELQNQNLNSDRPYIFITGGDAYRRYLTDIKRTSDIDAKLIYSNHNDKKMLLKLIIRDMSRLVSIIYHNKSIMFKDFNTSYSNNDLNIQFIPVYDGGQVRIRYVESDDFILLSMDFRTKLNVTITDVIRTQLDHEIAILDVVLIKSDSLYENTVKISNQLPIASPKYLIKDLKNIYREISTNLKARFHKSSKDRARFNNLYKYLLSTNVYLHNLGNLDRRTSSLKRKAREALSSIPIDIKRANPKRIRADYMDIDEDHAELINIKTLDVRFNNIYYTSLISLFRNISDRYYNSMLNIINENNAKPINEYSNKLKLSFNEIKTIFDGTPYEKKQYTIEDIDTLMSDIQVE